MLITYKKLSLNQKSTYYYILCYFPIQFCVSLCIGCTGKRSGISVKGLRKFLSSEELCCLCLEHFILHCAVFDLVRTPIISDIDTELTRAHSIKFHELSEDNQIQINLDCTTLLKSHKNRTCSIERLSPVEFHNRRLVHWKGHHCVQLTSSAP